MQKWRQGPETGGRCQRIAKSKNAVQMAEAHGDGQEGRRVRLEPSHDPRLGLTRRELLHS
jgi:hypothetical protein